MRKTIAILAALSAVALALPAMAAHDENPSPRVASYAYDLGEVADNAPGVSGTVRLKQLPNGKIQVNIEAWGLTPNAPHAQHLHGQETADGSGFVRGACPTLADDGNLGRPVDGLIDTVEGVPAYGLVRASLTTSGGTGSGDALAVARFPVADATGYLEYSRTFRPEDSRVWNDLGELEVVVHGVDLNGNGIYDFEAGASSLDPSLPLEATIPALCGGPNG